MPESVQEYVERSRREQGLPPRVENERTLRLIAGLLDPAAEVRAA